MGRSTAQQLIQRAKNMNEYNNSGVSNDAVWIDHFNAALVEMVDDLELFGIIEDIETQIYTLPDDYYSLLSLMHSNGQLLKQRRDYDSKVPGYWVLSNGPSYTLDIVYHQTPSFRVSYLRYPENLEVSLKETQKPEIPTAGETALCYKAVYFALLNNNQPGQAKYFDDLYKKERANVRLATHNAKGE